MAVISSLHRADRDIISREVTGSRVAVRVTSSNTSIMETVMEEILIIQEMVVVEPVIYVVTSGVPIRCANAWEVIFAHAYKIKRNRLYGDADGSCYRLERNLSLVKAMIFVIGTTIIGLILSPQKLYLVTFFGFCVYVLLAERIQEKEEQGQTSFLVKGHIWIKGVVYHAMLVTAVVLMQYLTGLDQIKKSVVYTFFSGHMAVFAIICIVAAELLWVLFDKAYFLFQQQYGHYLKINE